MFRGVKRLEHGEIARALGLDPVRFRFELPSSVRLEGSNRSGFGGLGGRRATDGYVWLHGESEPFARITIGHGRIRDDDPCSMQDLFRLGR